MYYKNGDCEMISYVYLSKDRFIGFKFHSQVTVSLRKILLFYISPRAEEAPWDMNKFNETPSKLLKEIN